DELLALHGAPGAELFHTGWRLEGVYTLGQSVGGNDALEEISDAVSAGVETYILTSGHLAGINFNIPSTAWLIDHGVLKRFVDCRFPNAGSNHFKFAVMKTNASAIALV